MEDLYENSEGVQCKNSRKQKQPTPSKWIQELIMQDT